MAHPFLDFIVLLHTDAAIAARYSACKIPDDARAFMAYYGVTDPGLQNVLLAQQGYSDVQQLVNAIEWENPSHVAPGGYNNVVCAFTMHLPNSPLAPGPSPQERSK